MMKGLFPQYDRSASGRREADWLDAVFVFDTNVLLNLYRYKAATRDELIGILEKLSDRIWIPHQVALEFQRNRVSVIADQRRVFGQVKKIIASAQKDLEVNLSKLQLDQRHSTIEVDELILNLQRVFDDFELELEVKKSKQLDLLDDDKIKEKVEVLFEDRVGPAFSVQEQLNKLYSEAKTRYEKKIPPGFEDSGKERSVESEFYHNGLIYQKKFGDFVAWRQILSYAKENKVKNLVFVTDDNKEDWWWKVDSDGSKTLGPRPELVEEALLEGGIVNFSMYRPEVFLNYAGSFVKAQISVETIREVRDVSRFTADEKLNLAFLMQAEGLVYDWLQERHQEADISRTGGFPDFVATVNGLRFGFEVRLASHFRFKVSDARRLVSRAHEKLYEESLFDCTIILVAINREVAEELRSAVESWISPELPERVHILIGFAMHGSDEESCFIPITEYSRRL